MPPSASTIIIVIVSLIIGAAVITYITLLIIQQRNRQQLLPFSCDTPVPAYSGCPTSAISSGIPGNPGSGFFTALKVVPDSPPDDAVTITPSSIGSGYYYAHPTTLFSTTGVLYTYPFILTVIPAGDLTSSPTLKLGAYSYTSTAYEVTNSTFDQYYYQNNGLDNGYDMGINCAIAAPPFQVDRTPYPSSGGPTLASMLSTSQVSIVANQGQPYITLLFNSSNSDPNAEHDLISMSQYSHMGISQVAVGPVTYLVYNFYRTTTRSVAWLIPNTYTATPPIISNGQQVTLRCRGPKAVVYITLLNRVGVLMQSVLQTLAFGLRPCFINLVDLIPTSDNSSMQYTIVPIANFDNGNSSVLWILPPTCFSSANLAAVSLPSSEYLDFPLGNGLFSTQHAGSTGGQLITFFTVWPPPTDISDFASYSLQNAGNAAANVTDTSADVNTDLDMYNLALTIRILYSTQRHYPTGAQQDKCTTSFQQKLNDITTNSQDYTIATASLGEQDAGLISRLAYLLLTYIHQDAVKSQLQQQSSAYGVIVEALPKISMMIQGFLTTAPISEQHYYAPLGLLDCYTCTIPMIKTVNPSPGFESLSSRAGEVLSYLWASNYILSTKLTTPPKNMAYLARCLFGIVIESTTRLLNGVCIADGSNSIPNLAPVMPWTGVVSPSYIGFRLDKASPGGTSPDAVMLQTFAPFTPATHHMLWPIFQKLSFSIEKLIRCTQPIPQASPAQYSYNKYIDPSLVGYFAYLYNPDNCSETLLTGRVVNASLSPFVDKVLLQHPAIGQFMNLVKLTVPASPLHVGKKSHEVLLR